MDDNASTISATDAMLFRLLSNSNVMAPEEMRIEDITESSHYTPFVENVPPKPAEEPLPVIHEPGPEMTAPANVHDIPPPPPDIPPNDQPPSPPNVPAPQNLPQASPNVPAPPDDMPPPIETTNIPDTFHEPKSTHGESSSDTMDAKRTVLLDLEQLKSQGVKLTREWNMDDDLDDMTLELRRHILAMDERSNVNMMRDGMRLLVTGIEMVNKRIGLLDLEGWSNEVCKDIHQHDPNLARIYRKYWKRSTSTSPEMDIVMSLATSMGFHHMKRTMSKQLMPSRPDQTSFAPFNRRKSRAQSPPTSDDEAAPGM